MPIRALQIINPLGSVRVGLLRVGLSSFRLFGWEIAAIVGKIGSSVGASGANMDNYQFYLLDRFGITARPPRVASFKDDEAALAEARKTLSDQTIEIWQGDRCVATLLQMKRVAGARVQPVLIGAFLAFSSSIREAVRPFVAEALTFNPAFS